MKISTRTQSENTWGQKFLQWINLRPEEADRTFFTFAFYTTTCVGQLWLEQSAIALFLEKYGAEGLPIIYIASALIGSGLGLLYSWLAKVIPLRNLLVAIAIFMALPLILFRFGLEVGIVTAIIYKATIFAMRLWMEGVDVLNDLNISIAANQLFNIREIKRTYPIIASGILVADVISGFSLPFLIKIFGLPNIIVMSGIMMFVGATFLFILCRKYPQSFPNTPVKNLEELQSEYATKKLQGPVKSYVIPLFAFFILGQVLFLLIEFQYSGELDEKFKPDEIASFLGIFNGITGLFELITQWFISSRAIEKVGVFRTAMLLPSIIITLSVITLTGTIQFLWGLVAIKFIDELFRYTLLASVSPVFFQPLPENLRNSVQTTVRGVAQTLSTGVTGLAILGFMQLVKWIFKDLEENKLFEEQSRVIVWLIIFFGILWFIAAWFLRSRYVSLLVQTAQAERISGANVDLKSFKKAVLDLFQTPGKTDADKRACIQLLYQIDPPNVAEVLIPLFPQMSPALLKQSLEVMLEHPNPLYLVAIEDLIEKKPPPEVMALGLRYIWLSDPEPKVNNLKPYLQDRVDPMVRSTAGSLILRLGNNAEKVEATNVLRKMLTSPREKERVMGCKALGDALAVQMLNQYIPDLLQDESLRVRCALLEVIALTHLEEYYPSLLRALYYKSTKNTARLALVGLGDDSIPMLLELAEDIDTPDSVKLQAFTALGELGTKEALDRLVEELMISWGTTRRTIMKILIKMPQDRGIEGTLERFGRSGIETLIEQELLFLGQIYAAVVDLESSEEWLGDNPNSVNSYSLLIRALKDLQKDVEERCFSLMKFLYPISAIQAAAFNLQSESRSSVALGLEILDNTLDIPQKRFLLTAFDKIPESEKLANLQEIIYYIPMNFGDRLRRLLDLRHFLSDWTLACCFHLAKQAKIALTPEQTLICLRHPTGFVREAVIAYLKAASPRTLVEMLPVLHNDPDRLVSAQVEQIMSEMK
jgi:hypothetical protein